MNLQQFLETLDARFDPATHLVWCPASTPGYHTRIPDGTQVHQTREAADYVLALLQSGEPQRVQRAHEVLEALLDLQRTDPTTKHYGIWGWFAQEPPEQMNPADWNWADFIGARLGQILICHGVQLRPATAARVRQALLHAAWSIFRRNVEAGYTNIAIMGAVVCAVAGETLDRPELLDYGRRRLQNVLQDAQSTGGFAEYNSPTYTRVALEELERSLLLVHDPALRETAEQLRHICWRQLAERFHPSTGQMAGPQSRAYSDWLSPALAQYLTKQTGATVQARTAGPAMNLTSSGDYELVKPLPCPPEYASRFSRLPADPLEVVTRLGTGPHGRRIATTWLSSEACLGSIGVGIGMVQQRTILGYWKTPDDPAVALRVRMLKQGKDLASSSARQIQRGPRLLSSWTLVRDGGDHHPTLDVPKDNTFVVSDLRLRIVSEGAGVQVRRLDDTRFELAAGDWRAVVHTAAVLFRGQSAHWEIGTTENEAYVDAVLYTGPELAIDFRIANLQLGFALEVIGRTAPATESPLTASPMADGNVLWQWQDLHLSAPVLPQSRNW